MQTVICGRLALLLRVRTTNIAASETGADVTQVVGRPVNRHRRENGNGHVPQLENNGISVIECADQKDSNSLASTSDVLYSIRDLLETNDQASIASSSSAAATGQSISPVERLLASMNDMMGARLRTDDQLRHQRDKNQQMISDWMIAAAVIDRICFIIFTFCFVVGTAVLFILATYIQ